MNKTLDENDKLRAGKLSSNPEQNARVVSIDGAPAPRVLTEREVLQAAATRAAIGTSGGSCTTGHYQLNAATGGIRPGHGWVFAATTNWGKSSWLVMVTDENLRLGKRVLIVSSEDDEAIYGARLLARRAKLDARRLRDGRLHGSEQAELDRVLAESGTKPLYLDARGKTAEWTAKQVGALIASEGIDLVAYDYLQEFTTSRPAENHRLTVKQIASTLRKVVKLAGKASVILSQVTESEQTHKRPFPTRDMIRDCRDVANAAEVILIGYTPEKAVEKNDETIVVPAGSRAIYVDKVKDGPKGFAVHAEWDDSSASFNRMDAPPGPYDDFDAHFQEVDA